MKFKTLNKMKKPTKNTKGICRADDQSFKNWKEGLYMKTHQRAFH